MCPAQVSPRQPSPAQVDVPALIVTGFPSPDHRESSLHVGRLRPRREIGGVTWGRGCNRRCCVQCRVISYVAGEDLNDHGLIPSGVRGDALQRVDTPQPYVLLSGAEVLDRPGEPIGDLTLLGDGQLVPGGTDADGRKSQCTCGYQRRNPGDSHLCLLDVNGWPEPRGSTTSSPQSGRANPGHIPIRCLRTSRIQAARNAFAPHHSNAGVRRFARAHDSPMGRGPGDGYSAQSASGR